MERNLAVGENILRPRLFFIGSLWYLEFQEFSILFFLSLVATRTEEGFIERAQGRALPESLPQWPDSVERYGELRHRSCANAWDWDRKDSVNTVFTQ